MASPGVVELAIASIWAIVAVFGAVVFGHIRQRRGIRARLATLHISSARQRGITARSFSPRRAIARLGQLFAERAPRLVENVRRDIDGSGLIGKIQPVEVLGCKVGLAGCGLFAGIGLACLVSQTSFLPVPVLAFAGWSAPSFRLSQIRRARLRRMLRDLPTIIDLLALSLQAGMGLDRALRIVSERVQSPLSDELRRVLSDISLGLTRQQAFAGLAERVESDEVRLLTSSIIQSEQLGTSLVSTIKNQAQQLRSSRRRKAEAQALKAPVKMLLPMVLFILPALFIIVLGPAGLNVGLALTSGNP